MLSRIANGLSDLGQSVERAQHVAQIVEVNHKMNLERASDDEMEVWQAISDAFDGQTQSPDERDIYEELVLADTHPYSVRYCVGRARFEGRAMREHISEEMWLHLNQAHLYFDALKFDSVLGIGRSEFNRRVTIFSDALSGLADDTMIRGEAWAFFKIGKLTERASMICQVLRIKESLITPGRDGAPIDVHQWQALLRSISGYEAYRRVNDARIVPSRVLEFVLKRKDFPRSLAGCLTEIREIMPVISPPPELDFIVTHLMEQLTGTRTEELLEDGSFPSFLDEISDLCSELSTATDQAFFTSSRSAQFVDAEAMGLGAVIQQ